MVSKKTVLTIVIVAVTALVAAGIIIGVVLSFQKKPDTKPDMPPEKNDGIYTVVSDDSDGGSIEISADGKPASDVKAGDTVTVSPTAKDGYNAWEVYYTDNGGNKVRVHLNEGAYKFIMPYGNVTVHVNFLKETEDSAFTFDYDAESDSYVLSGFKGTDDTIVFPSAYDDGVHGERPVSKMEYVYDVAAFSEVYIPRSITSISDSAFLYNTDLKKVEFAEGCELDYIGTYAFYGAAITDIVIPSSVEKIDGSAFDSCESLKTVSFAPDSRMQTIEMHAFAACTSLESVVIPASVKSISSDIYSPFYMCDSLSAIYYGGSEEEWAAFSGKPSGVEVYFYSESAQAAGGNYWHYDDYFMPVSWN